MPSAPVSISNDLTLALSITPLMTVHDCVTVPPGALPPYIPHLELPVTVMWPPGFALMQNKLTTTVLHQMMPIGSMGTTAARMIVHVPIPPMPPNAKVLLHIAFSSRKAMFAASKVKANGTPVACTSLWFPIPMTCCANPFTLPIGTAPLNLLNTVRSSCRRSRLAPEGTGAPTSGCREATACGASAPPRMPGPPCSDRFGPTVGHQEGFQRTLERGWHDDRQHDEHYRGRAERRARRRRGAAHDQRKHDHGRVGARRFEVRVE